MSSRSHPADKKTRLHFITGMLVVTMVYSVTVFAVRWVIFS
ncbi:MAG TPA: hypothetical protein VIL86_19465 [Tepidisphaeraceae bacterium]